jgi:hypothetical protein
MALRRRSHISGWLIGLAAFCIASGLAITSVAAHRAARQPADQPTEEAWDTPVNLSHSGATTKPVIFTDSSSAVHVIWRDTFANYVETRLDGGQWSEPQTTSLDRLFETSSSQPANNASPFTGPNPLFVAGDRPIIYAFWINPQGKLYASQVPTPDLAKAGSWTARKLLSDSATSFTAAVDARGDLHLVYIRTTAATGKRAGLYYTRLRKFGTAWLGPVLVYESPYFGGLSGAKANLSLATAGTADAPIVYIAWDNQPRKEVLLTKSTDGGVSWEKPMLVAGPQPNSELVGPYNIRVGAAENRVVLVWQSGQQTGPCTQFFIASADAGATWSEAQSMLEGVTGCAEANEFVASRNASPGGLLYLLTTLKRQVFLSAWNGSQWSEPQEQPVLSGFKEPEIFTSVLYGCHQATWLQDRLYVVGCDTGEGGDIWVTSRGVASASTWFTPPVWKQPAPVTSQNFAVTHVAMVATDDELLHVFFSVRQDPTIYYTRWDGTAWSRTTPVLRLPEGEAESPAVAAGPGNGLFLIARSSSGSLYFSRANSTDAVMEAGWSAPTPIRLAHDGKLTPADVTWDAAGTLTVAYSISVNEARGVYLVQSKDAGKTWSAPLQVFDGAAADFDIVGSPSLLVATDGSVHVLWKQQSIPVEGVSQTLALYYARSEDAGKTFSKAELVVQAPVGWRAIVADGKGNLHRLWQQPDIKSTLWDQVSTDGGRSWPAAQRLPAEDGPAAVTVDRVGQVHLMDEGLGSLGHWLWDSSRWQAEPLNRWSLASVREVQAEYLAAAVNRAGKLVVVLTVPAGASDESQRLLLYSTRTLEIPAGSAAVNENLTGSSGSPKQRPVTIQ